MDGNESAQVKYLHDKAKDFAAQLSIHKVTKNDAWYALERSFLKTIEYPLMVTTIPFKTWSSILSPVINTLFRGQGFPQNSPGMFFLGPVNTKVLVCPTPGIHRKSNTLLPYSRKCPTTHRLVNFCRPQPSNFFLNWA